MVPDFDAKSPNVARVYDTLIGGKDNYEPDRGAAAELAGAAPHIAVIAGENKQFAVRATEWLAKQGITQFIDLGCGMPLSPNTHETVGSVSPDARVAYVDIDQVVVNHMGTFAQPGSGVVAVRADARDSAATREALAGTIDFSRPVAVLMCALLHFYDNDTARELVAGHTAGLADGSYLAASVLGTGGAEMERFVRAYSAAVAPVRSYTVEELTGVLGPVELVPPGVARQNAWRPGWQEASGQDRDFGGWVTVARVGGTAG
jgi:hypothetical protein